MPGLFSRIYLYLSRDYFVNFPDCDIDRVLKDVAECRVKDENDNKLFERKEFEDSAEKDFYMGRIKKLIIKEANKFISDFEKAYSTESLGQYISKRQIKSLVRAFEDKEGKITGYSFVIFQIIFGIVKDIPNYDFDNLKNCITAVYNVVKDYSNDYPKDPVACFLLGCYEVVFNEISSQRKVSADKTEFPPIPIRHHNDYDE